MYKLYIILFLLLFVKHKAQETIRPNLLQGKWQLQEDTNSYLLIYKDCFFTYYEGSKKWELDEFVLTSNCLNKSNYSAERSSIINTYITLLKKDECFGVSELNQNHLELTHLARGNSLGYKRVLDDKYFPKLNINDYLPNKDSIVFLPGKRVVNREYVYLHNEPKLESQTNVYINNLPVVYCDKYYKGFAYCYYDIQNDNSEGGSLAGDLKGWLLESALGVRLTTEDIIGYYTNGKGFSIEITEIDELDQATIFTAIVTVKDYTTQASGIVFNPSVDGYTFKCDFSFNENDLPLSVSSLILNSEGIIKGLASYGDKKFEFNLSKQSNDIEPVGISKENERDEEMLDVYTVVEQIPEFPGGATALKDYITKELKVPSNFKTNGNEAKCFLKFVVNEDGSISHIVVLKSIPDCQECNVEAIRVIQAMPKWKPGKQNGKSVKVYYNLPIKFK